MLILSNLTVTSLGDIDLGDFDWSGGVRRDRSRERSAEQAQRCGSADVWMAPHTRHCPGPALRLVCRVAAHRVCACACVRQCGAGGTTGSVA
jgi:hypothetical protein